MPSTITATGYSEELIVLPTANNTFVREALARIDSFGGRLLQFYSPRVLLAHLPEGSLETVEASIQALGVDFPATFFLAPPPLASAERLGIEAFKVRRSPEYTEEKEAREGAGLSWGQDPPDPPDFAELFGSKFSGEEHAQAPEPDTSSYLIGRVAVGIVVVEGPTPEVAFTDDERLKITTEVQQGLSWLGTQEPAANVIWTNDLRLLQVDVAPDPKLPLQVEAREAPWRDAALSQLGYPPGMAGVHQYVKELRNQTGADWAYVGFFTKYPLWHFAYAGKPRVVMDYRNGGWGPDSIAEVFAHETGHIFGCPDEYWESNCGCGGSYGYLGAPNGNCERCAKKSVACVMSRNDTAMCEFTRLHLGWRDSKGDGVLDPLRT